MKITRSQLKRIIKEEMQRTLLTEEIDIKNDYPNIHEHIVLPLQCEIVQAHSTSGLNIDCGAGGPSNEDWFDAETNEGNHNNETIKFDVPEEVWPNNQAELDEFKKFENTKYPRNIELTMDPPTVTNDVLEELLNADNDALEEELKALALILAPPSNVGSFTLQIIPPGVTSGGGGYRQRSEIDID